MQVTRADLVVCFDANFVQKQHTLAHNAARNGPVQRPQTVFLTEKEVSEAQELDEAFCPGPPQAANSPDALENGLKVSCVVLDACSDSFKAVDEKCSKASSQYFADTRLMGLLCCHDHVLWLVNMTTPREQQFYAIALIIKLFQSIPSHLTVGILYDRMPAPSKLHQVGLYIRLHWPDYLEDLHFSCIWASIALSVGLLPPQMCWIWFIRQQRL
jgi:hypothetical protein